MVQGLQYRHLLSVHPSDGCGTEVAEKQCRQTSHNPMRVYITNWSQGITRHILLILVLFFYSSGCGRTGTYIAIEILIERLKAEGVVDVFRTVRTLRQQRPSMVRTEVSTAIIILRLH